MLNTKEIKRRRNALKLSLAQAAKAAGWESRAMWYDIETGRRTNITINTAIDMARVLGCKVDDLIAK